MVDMNETETDFKKHARKKLGFRCINQSKVAFFKQLLMLSASAKQRSFFVRCLREFDCPHTFNESFREYKRLLF